VAGHAGSAAVRERRADRIALSREGTTLGRPDAVTDPRCGGGASAAQGRWLADGSGWAHRTVRVVAAALLEGHAATSVQLRPQELGVAAGVVHTVGM
jgi:hypothetical protein